MTLCISVKRDIGQEILEGIQEIKAHKAGKKTLHTHTLKEPAAPQVIRAKLKLPQSTFAGLMGVSLRKVQDGSKGGVNQAARCCFVAHCRAKARSL